MEKESISYLKESHHISKMLNSERSALNTLNNNKATFNNIAQTIKFYKYWCIFFMWGHTIKSDAWIINIYMYRVNNMEMKKKKIFL